MDSAKPVSREVVLAEALLAGDASAFTEFVELFRQKIFQYSLLMCGHREDAEEVSQDTLLKVFENFEQLQDPTHVRAWVFRIAKNACLLKRRKSIFAPKTELSLEDYLPTMEESGGAARMQIADWRAVPDDLALQSELKQILLKALRELPELYRSVLLLRDVEDLSTEDTAQILGISDDAVKTRLHRARLAIRKKLDRHLLDAASTLRA